MARQTKLDAQFTRARIVEAALAEFAVRGMHATTMEDVAVRAGVTRGAVYWHFADKSALVAAVITGLDWPLDIGMRVEAYQAHPRPLELLGRALRQRIERCANTPSQWQAVQLVLHQRYQAPTPGAMAQVMHTMDGAVHRLSQVMAIALHRRQLRAELAPLAVAQGLHAVGMGMLSEWSQASPRRQRHMALLGIELFLRGASANHTPAWHAAGPLPGLAGLRPPRAP